MRGASHGTPMLRSRTWTFPDPGDIYRCVLEHRCIVNAFSQKEVLDGHEPYGSTPLCGYLRSREGSYVSIVVASPPRLIHMKCFPALSYTSG
jgi:hypothetical protein